MIKKLLRASAALITVISLSASVFAVAYAASEPEPYTGSLSANPYSQNSKQFEANTKCKNGAVDEITAGLSVLNYYTGGTHDEDFTRKYNASEVSTYCYVAYSAATKVTAYGSHSAYDNGTCTFYKFTNQTFPM